MSEKPLIIGVAGGSGSGKTTVVDKILQRIGKSNIQLIEHDSYYRDLKHLPFSEREKENFDHPSALETELMIHHLEALRRGEEVQMPVYDFVTQDRKSTRLNSSHVAISYAVFC